MGLPVFPKLPKPSKKKKIFRLLLETIALEELALAALINAEAEKVQEIKKAGLESPVSAEDAAKINESVAKVIEAAEKKEQQLNQKLKTILNVMKEKDDDDECDDDE